MFKVDPAQASAELAALISGWSGGRVRVSYNTLDQPDINAASSADACSISAGM